MQLVSGELNSSAQKVQNALKNLGLNCQVVEMPASTRTARDAAQVIGCAVEQIAKSLVFRTRSTNRPVLVIASGSNRVNEKQLGDLLGEGIEKADADFVRQHTGFVIGGVPPLGHTQPLKTYLDEDLRRHEAIWAAAGSSTTVFRLTSTDLAASTGGEWIPVK
jgi:prolyl-tRNA editing enzyme YbaK/EbsC (Cys-tRNA(Pro) deacylase)